MREDRQLSRILEIINSYSGDLPLHLFLKQFFRKHREMGSRDRKLTSDLVYSWFRIGKSLRQLSKEERLACACFLVLHKNNSVADHVIQKHSSLSIHDIALPPSDKIKIAKERYGFRVEDIFSFATDLSNGIIRYDYALSMLTQPLFWIRVQSDFVYKTEEVLLGAAINYRRDGNSFGLEAGINLPDCGVKEEWFEVQDRSSQHTGELFRPSAGERWYDCCAASGGKSLLLLSLQSDIELTVTDSRDSILLNLKERFLKNNVRKYNAFTADLTLATPKEIARQKFDGIIADVPCSGSGTWSRTPEQLSFFKEESISELKGLQEGVIRNVIPLLQKGNPLIYITCSVFRDENETRVEWICNELGFEAEEMELFTGFYDRADTLFAARLIRK